MALDIGEVTQQAKERHVRGWYRTCCHGRCVEIGALHLERAATVGEVAEEHRPLVVREPPVGSRVVLGCDEHVGPTEAPPRKLCGRFDVRHRARLPGTCALWQAPRCDQLRSWTAAVSACSIAHVASFDVRRLRR